MNNYILENQTDEALKVLVRNLLRFPIEITTHFRDDYIIELMKKGIEHFRFDFDARDNQTEPSNQNKKVISAINKYNLSNFWNIEVYSRKGTIEVVLWYDMFDAKRLRVYNGNSLGTVDICLGILKIVNHIDGEKYLSENVNKQDLYCSSARVEDLISQGFMFDAL